MSLIVNINVFVHNYNFWPSVHNSTAALWWKKHILHLISPYKQITCECAYMCKKYTYHTTACIWMKEHYPRTLIGTAVVGYTQLSQSDLVWNRMNHIHQNVLKSISVGRGTLDAPLCIFLTVIPKSNHQMLKTALTFPI